MQHSTTCCIVRSYHPHALDQWDQHTFPGVVPRTFVGALAVCAVPVLMWEGEPRSGADVARVSRVPVQVALASSPLVAVLHIVNATGPKIAAHCAATRRTPHPARSRLSS